VHVRTETGGFREIVVVIALALVGLVLAAAAALVPWRVGAAMAPMIGVEAPAQPGPAS
jgi:hypothetical protein